MVTEASDGSDAAQEEADGHLALSPPKFASVAETAADAAAAAADCESDI